MKTLPREPWRSGQICGYQTEYGTGRSVFCGEFKKVSSPACEEHDRELREDNYGRLPKFAHGNALGVQIRKVGDGWTTFNGYDYSVHYTDRGRLERVWGFTLSWETEDPGKPEPATDEEIAAWKAS